MKKYRCILLALLFCGVLSSCFEDRDDSRCISSDRQIKDFIYEGMNVFYLYKDDQPVLSNNYFSSQQELNDYLGQFSSPESFFANLTIPKDEFSVLIKNYKRFEKRLNGISLSNGMAFGLVQLQSTGDIFGYVRYVLPHSSASQKGVERGMLFNRIDGVSFTSENYNDLLAPKTYTIGLAELDNNGNLSSVDQEITLTKMQYTENPVYIDTVLTVDNIKIGYLMYNSFTGAFDDELNAVFASFKAKGIEELVVDLRYNGGGSIESSSDLASMITGQFKGELFTKQVYNDNFEPKKRFFNDKIRTGASIHNLNLNQVYILTTNSTASASELLISSLLPYIDVTQIGTATRGKYQGSITVYDSPDFTRDNVNLCHSYALQPLVLKAVNANGFTGYENGIEPDAMQAENFRNLGELGNPNEPLLAKAISLITGTTTRSIPVHSPHRYKIIGEDGMGDPNFQRMYNNRQLKNLDY